MDTTTEAAAEQPAVEESQDDGHGQGLSHLMPIKVLVGVWIALMILTWLTWYVTNWNLDELFHTGGGANLILALLIATVKASAVALYFMHLRYDHPFNAFILIASLAFVALFIYFALVDTLEYKPLVEITEPPPPAGP